MLIRSILLKTDAFRKLRRQFVPEGHPKIAQHFNAGLRQEGKRVPEGRLKTLDVAPGLRVIPPYDPALKRWAILTPSLQDKKIEFPKGIILKEASPPRFLIHALHS